MYLCSRNRLLFTALALALATACAQERPPINRVQPYALQKSFFVGEKLLDPSDDPEFWAQGTLIDVGYGAGQSGLFTSTYAQPVTRVKFKIEENYLTARLSYELVNDTDHKGAGASSNDGVVVAMYRITNHFDIKRSYNPQTGEEANVLEENSYDRPWYEREYMRVDWSRNLQSDAYELDTLSALGIDGVTYEPVAYWVNDPDAEDAPHFDLANGYMDVTHKAFARPELVDISRFGWGIRNLPACYLDADFLGGPGVGTQCNPVELTFRQSFRRVDERDYEPEDWNGTKFKAFGAFTVDRRGYDRKFGIVDTKWYRFIARYNIWEQSHYYDKSGKAVECYTPANTPAGMDPNRDGDEADASNPANGTADECEAVTGYSKFGGSQCDIFKQKCTLPYRARKAKPLAWYMSNVSNYEYFDGTDWAAHEWDVALRHAIMTAKYAECRRDTDEATCRDQYPVLTGQIDEENDAVRLAWEVDQCRRSLVYRDVDCNTLADDDMKARCTRMRDAYKMFSKCESIIDSDEGVAAKRGYSEAVKMLAHQPEMVVLCHSPVQWDDPDLCVTDPSQKLPKTVSAAMCADAIRSNKTDLLAQCRAALNVRMGDLRFHHVNVIQAPQTGSPWGIMVDSVDPITGMKVAASINVWSHVTDMASQGVIDQSRFAKGELSVNEITEGDYVKDWSSVARNASNGSLGGITKDEMTRRLAEFAQVDIKTMKAAIDNPDKSKANALLNAKVWPTGPNSKEKRSLLDVLRDVKFDAHSVQGSTHALAYETRRLSAENSNVEAELTTPMMQQLAGNFGTKVVSGTLLDLASPERGANPTFMREMTRERELALNERGICMLNEAPVGIAVGPMADLLERKFDKFNANDSKSVQLARAEKMRKYIAQRYQFAVIAHEMGHSIGLRHNFVSSSDSFNYRPQYWQLRTNDGTVSAECTDLKSVDQAANCVGPRWYDPVTPAEKDNMLWMFMNSSVMEYPGEVTQDMIGIGAYDFGAARMFYGDAVAVYTDASYRLGTDRGNGAFRKMDDFGGMLGFTYQYRGDIIHYSQLQKNYQLIQSCKPVADLTAFKPLDWNEARDGKWDPVMDSMLVSPKNDGTYTRCKQQPIDFVQWTAMLKNGDVSNDSDRQVDDQGRIRVPYGFATDRWADIGNIAVYRHDNGADPYETFDFFITSQEMNHIFDNYRRNRSTFTVYGAASRALSRYNEKMRDGAKGLGLFVNIYKRGIQDTGLSFADVWPMIVDYYRSNVLASTMAFDHFARQMSRPEEGDHFLRTHLNDPVLRSVNDYIGGSSGETVANPIVSIPNGAFGTPWGNIGFGGRPIENRLKEGDCGEYCAEFTVNAGSYYDKAWTTMLLTESEDRFISDRRGDFTDARYRNISMADLFPDGFRRMVANNLTGDDFIKGPRVHMEKNLSGAVTDINGYPRFGLGWVSWTGTQPKVCFQGYSTLNEGQPDTGMSYLKCDTDPTGSNGYPTAAIDPQIGWEQWKFIVAYTMHYLPENQQLWWLDQLRIWEIGADTDPAFQNRIEFHDPTGSIYVAKTSGKETIFGKTVQKGISARVLEWANSLLKDAYETTDGLDLDHDGTPDWYIPKLNSSGQPVVKFDPNMFKDGGGQYTREDCNATTNVGCTCDDNRHCRDLQNYVPLLRFIRQSLATYGMADPSMRGIYR